MVETTPRPDPEDVMASALLSLDHSLERQLGGWTRRPCPQPREEQRGGAPTPTPASRAPEEAALPNTLMATSRDQAEPPAKPPDLLTHRHCGR